MSDHDVSVTASGPVILTVPRADENRTWTIVAQDGTTITVRNRHVEERLVIAARAALIYFQRRQGGSQVNGPNDEVLIGRRLSNALEAYADVPTIRESER